VADAFGGIFQPGRRLVLGDQLAALGRVVTELVQLAVKALLDKGMDGGADAGCTCWFLGFKHGSISSNVGAALVAA